MPNKSLAQLEIGSPEWIAKRKTLGIANPPAMHETPPGLLAIGALAIAVGAVFMTAVRFGAFLARRH